MSFCQDWSLVKAEPGRKSGRPLFCRSWSCPECAPRRRAQLMAEAAAGNPTRFMTLTVNPATGSDPADRMRRLAWAFRTMVKRLRRARPGRSIEYLAVVEATEAGEPHLHVLLRSPYLPQHELSAIMDELTEAPVVDIRKVRSARDVVRYVAKYIAKAPARFDGSKRYWSSQHWEQHSQDELEQLKKQTSGWSVDRNPLWLLERIWRNEGFSRLVNETDTLVMVSMLNFLPRAGP